MSKTATVRPAEGTQTTEALEKLLADTYTLALKTQNFHWNVTGERFVSLHALFETQYNALALAVDAVAERIRALGSRAPGSFAAFLEAADIEEATGREDAERMMASLAEDHERVSKTAEAVLEAAQSAEDAVTEDLAVERMAEHQKAAWMLRSSAR